MAEIRTVTTLRSKHDEIAATIKAYEHRLSQARADLAHITATIALFEATGQEAAVPPYVNMFRMFGRGEAFEVCKEALREGPMTTRQLALRVMEVKGLDATDKVLAKVVGSKLINMLRGQWLRGALLDGGKRSGVRVWKRPVGDPAA